MTEVYVGQIMMTGFNFAPKGFALCNGQLLSIQQNQALFALLGVTYGGNGSTNFQLPNLQGRTPVGSGASVDPSWQPAPYMNGTVAGTENVTIGPNETPMHTHFVNASTTTATLKNATNAFYATSSVTAEPIYAPSNGPLVALDPTTLSTIGGSLPHNNMQPFRVINFNIALSGVFPSRN